MNKKILLGMLSIAFASAAYAQTEVVEVYENVNQYGQIDRWENDCRQGTLINKNTSNWFITAEGGANMVFGKYDIKAEIKNRIDGSGALYVGKWVSPNFGFRFGAKYIMAKGATIYDGGTFQKWNSQYPVFKDGQAEYGYVDQKWMGLGPEFDVLINLTNWWCGYKPGRVYNAVLHGGAGAYFRWAYKKIGEPENTDLATTFGYEQAYWPDSKLRYARHQATMFGSLGLQNNFRLSRHVDIFIDLQYQIMRNCEAANNFDQIAEVFVGFNFNLGKTDWGCPVVPVCADITPILDQINALEKQVADLEARNRQLQAELDACLAREPQVVTKGDCSQLLTVYYPINVYSLSNREKTVLKTVASVMKAHPEEKYQLIGWADNWTGSSDYNESLRWKRVDGVKKYLLSLGVPESQLEVKVDNGNLVATAEYDEFNAGVIEAKSAPLDRAVTIRLAE